MLQSVIMEVQRLYKSVMYINTKSVLYLYGISSVFDSKVCGFCRVESGTCLRWYQDLWLMNELLWVFKRTWQVFYKLYKGIKLRLERENQVLIIQLSISNLFFKLFHQVDVVSTFSSVFLIYMEEHLLRSIKMLSLTSASNYFHKFFDIPHFSLILGLIYFKLNWHTVLGNWLPHVVNLIHFL